MTDIVARKRSGMTGARTFRLQAKLKVRVQEILSTTVALKLTWDDQYDRLNKEVFHTPEWKKVPQYVRSYIDGYIDCWRAQMYRDHIKWMLSLDGLLLTNTDIDAITRQEVRDGGMWESTTRWIDITSKDYRSPWSRIDGDKSRHVWLDKPGGLPLSRKPLDRKWVV